MEPAAWVSIRNKASSQTRKITEMPGYNKASNPVVALTVKSQTANNLVHTYATDIRPFSIVDGGGFKKVAQKFHWCAVWQWCVTMFIHSIATFRIHCRLSQITAMWQGGWSSKCWRNGRMDTCNNQCSVHHHNGPLHWQQLEHARSYTGHAVDWW